MPASTPEQIASFITRWEKSGGAERANYQMFLSELCDIIEVPRPDPTTVDPAKNLHPGHPYGTPFQNHPKPPNPSQAPSAMNPGATTQLLRCH